MLVLEEILLKREYADVERHLLNQEATIVDLGANIGLSACLWARMCPRAKIVAVEPDKGNAALCQQNLSLRVSVFEIVVAFIGSKDGTAYIDRSGGEWAYRKTERLSSSDNVPVISMRSLFSRYVPPGRDVDLLKMDIEGAEAEVIPQLSEWLPRCHMAVIELHHEWCTFEHLRCAIDQARLEHLYEVTQLSYKGATSTVLLRRRGQST